MWQHKKKKKKKIGTDWITVALLYLEIDVQFAPVTLSWNQNQAYGHTLIPLASDLPYAEKAAPSVLSTVKVSNVHNSVFWQPFGCIATNIGVSSTRRKYRLGNPFLHAW